MTRTTTQLWAAAALLLVAAAAASIAETTDSAGTPPAAPSAAVEAFARAFFAGEQAALAEAMDATMREALSEEQATALRAQLTSANGAVQTIGSAWHEDDVATYRRYRVPVVFEKSALDMRVVLDRSGKVAGLFFVPHVEPPDATVSERAAAEAPVSEVEVTVGDEASGLPGTLSLPNGPGPHPGVVLVHGSGPNDRDETLGPNKPFRDLAWGLAQRGVAVLRYDKRSLVRPESLAAVGDYLTVQQEVVDDARLALALLRARGEVTADRVFVLGHSLGGTVAPRIAEASPPPAGIVVLAGAAQPLPEKMLEQVRYIAMVDGTVSPTERQRIDALATEVAVIRSALDGDSEPYAGQRLGAPFAYYKDLEARDPPAIAKRLGLPTLVLQGGRDYQVTVDGDFARWREALERQPRACLRVYPELDHLFMRGEGPSTPADYEEPRHVDKRVIDDVANFIVTGRCPREAPATR